MGEAANTVLGFAVTLDRAPSGTVMVDYATSDGTATAGSDCTATSGALTFAAGEAEKTVSMPVLDDAHDEGSEMLTLSNASVAYIPAGPATIAPSSASRWHALAPRCRSRPRFVCPAAGVPARPDRPARARDASRGCTPDASPRARTRAPAWPSSGVQRAPASVQARLAVIATMTSLPTLVGATSMRQRLLYVRNREYERAGTASVFMFCEPLSGWRQATARSRRTRSDWAEEIAGLLEGRYAACRCPGTIRLTAAAATGNERTGRGDHRDAETNPVIEARAPRRPLRYLPAPANRRKAANTTTNATRRSHRMRANPLDRFAAAAVARKDAVDAQVPENRSMCHWTAKQKCVPYRPTSPVTLPQGYARPCEGPEPVGDRGHH